MIYIAQLRGHRPVKIGVVENDDDVDKRIGNLQVSSPFPVDLLGIFPGDETVERQLHDKYQGYRLRGEWFNIPEHELDKLLELAIL